VTVLSSLKTWARGIKRDVVALWIAARDPRVPWYAKVAAGAVAAPAPVMEEFRQEAIRRSKPTSRAGMVFIALIWLLAAAGLIWLFWPNRSAWISN